MTHRILVTLDDTGLSHLDKVVADLREAGMRIEQVIEPVGTITGSAPEEALAAVQEVEGVDYVEPEQAPYQLPDPDSDIQ
ncbi:hypothetical protein [Alloactinosynnema sp. L-07]|uniref:hypothetical protein n=1 Tax=Alloactinosynnema sp. L-07 TaxID=1653480 RepID=UPI00065F08EB|nr:hypothetical protein [Alloactinosynnema sp. L-07]CRK57422.1 hypothetical protein [Alloactinosynnema sp. L-07]